MLALRAADDPARAELGMQRGLSVIAIVCRGLGRPGWTGRPRVGSDAFRVNSDAC